MGSRPFQTFMAMYSHPSGSLKRRCVSTTLLSPVGCHCPSQPFLAVGLALGLNRMPLACHAAAARCSTSWLNFRLNIRQPVKYTIFSPARIVLNWDLNVVLFMGMGSSTFEEMRPTGNADKRGDDDQGNGDCAVFAHGRSSTMKLQCRLQIFQSQDRDDIAYVRIPLCDAFTKIAIRLYIIHHRAMQKNSAQ